MVVVEHRQRFAKRRRDEAVELRSNGRERGAPRAWCILLGRPLPSISVGERCMENKNFPTLTKINLGDEHLREERLHLHTLVDR